MKKYINVICALTILSLTLTGCDTTLQSGTGKDTVQSNADITEGTDTISGNDIYGYEDTASDSDTEEEQTPYVDTASETAPMPDTDLSETDLLGYWSPDIQEAEPRILHFYYGDDGEVQYEYYTVLLGNGQGLNIANATTQFEFNKGKVVVNLTQGTCMCMVGDTDRSYMEFYLSEMKDGIIYDQEDGKMFYRCETE